MLRAMFVCVQKSRTMFLRRTFLRVGSYSHACVAALVLSPRFIVERGVDHCSILEGTRGIV